MKGPLRILGASGTTSQSRGEPRTHTLQRLEIVEGEWLLFLSHAAFSWRGNRTQVWVRELWRAPQGDQSTPRRLTQGQCSQMPDFCAEPCHRELGNLGKVPPLLPVPQFPHWMRRSLNSPSPSPGVRVSRAWMRLWSRLTGFTALSSHGGPSCLSGPPWSQARGQAAP